MSACLPAGAAELAAGALAPPPKMDGAEVAAAKDAGPPDGEGAEEVGAGVPLPAAGVLPLTAGMEKLKAGADAGVLRPVRGTHHAVSHRRQLGS